MGWWIAIAFVSGLAALVLQARQVESLRRGLASERAERARALEECARLRTDLARAVGDREELENRLSEAVALRGEEGAYR